MKTYLLLSATIFTIACTPSEKFAAVTEAEAKTKINEVMDQWHADATTGNFEGYFGVMDSISIFYGTDATENWTKQEFAAFAEPYFDEDGAWKFDPFDRNIYFSESGQVAWFDELLNTWMGLCIGSGVLERKGEEWKIRHYVLSVLIPNDDIYPVLEAKRTSDSTFLVSRGMQLKAR